MASGWDGAALPQCTYVVPGSSWTDLPTSGRWCPELSTAEGTTPKRADVHVAGSIAWGMVAGGYRPDRNDIVGALVCLVGVAVIMYTPRSH